MSDDLVLTRRFFLVGGLATMYTLPVLNPTKVITLAKEIPTELRFVGEPRRYFSFGFMGPIARKTNNSRLITIQLSRVGHNKYNNLLSWTLNSQSLLSWRSIGPQNDIVVLPGFPISLTVQPADLDAHFTFGYEDEEGERWREIIDWPSGNRSLETWDNEGESGEDNEVRYFES